MKKIILLSLCLTSQLAFAENPQNVHISGISSGGDGCPQGSVSATISPDGQAFSVLMDNYNAESSPQRTIDRKTCELRVQLNVPPGWSYQIISADHRGFAHAEAGSIATHQVIYSFDGSRPINERPGYETGPGRYSFRTAEFRGPYSDNYTVHNEIDQRIAPASPCNNSNTQTLFISTYLMARTLTQGNSFAQITLDSIDGALQSQQYQLAWKRCTPSSNGPGGPGVRPPRYPDPGRGGGRGGGGGRPRY